MKASFDPKMASECPSCGRIIQGNICNTCRDLRNRFAMESLKETQRQFAESTKEMVEDIARQRGYSGPMPGLIAICCYEMADAMMEARKPKPSADKVGGE